MESASSTSPAPPVGDDLAREDRVGADVVGDRGDDRRVLGEVERAARRPALAGRPAEVRHGVHRVGGRAAVAERQQLAAAVEVEPQPGGRLGQLVAVLAERLGAQLADLLGLDQHRAAHVLQHRVRGRARPLRA